METSDFNEKEYGIRIFKIVGIAVGSLVALIALLFLALYIHDARPWKVKDPANPRFDVTKFDPNDYLNAEELVEVMRQLLKPGESTKADVDNLWCKQTPCSINKSSKGTTNSELLRCASVATEFKDADEINFYSEPGKTPIFGLWTFWVLFDDDSRLRNACLRGVVVFAGHEVD